MCYNVACIRVMANGVFKVTPFDGLIFIYQTDSVGYASKRVFWKFIDFELYEVTNFIVFRIYAEALDRLRVRLNMYLVRKKVCFFPRTFIDFNHATVRRNLQLFLWRSLS